MCVRVRVCCACRVEPCGKGPRKPGLRVMGLSLQEEWKVLERGNGRLREEVRKMEQEAGLRSWCSGIGRQGRHL